MGGKGGKLDEQEMEIGKQKLVQINRASEAKTKKKRKKGSSQRDKVKLQRAPLILANSQADSVERVGH